MIDDKIANRWGSESASPAEDYPTAINNNKQGSLKNE
ncbi:hypothetical protein M2366_001193 [Aeromonas sp. BIGb0405]|nr:hypothetical protein [Aeromonas sp. BIGb0405]MCS3458106.1 hypothetical protein [Aeromonas sp. BIGb0445]